MDYDSIEDLASGKWIPGMWGDDEYKPTKLQKEILQIAKKLRKLVKKYLEEA